MSKFSILDKLKLTQLLTPIRLFLPVLVFVLLQGSAYARKNRAAAEPAIGMAVSIQNAKGLMAQGNRKAAIEQLNRGSGAAKTRSEEREIAARRRLFAEQFLTSESFQFYQEARGLAALERWDECLRELDSVGDKDKDNLLVLRQRAECQLALKKYSAAEATLKQALTLLPADSPTLFSLAEIALATGLPQQGLSVLDSVEVTGSIEQERIVILRAKLLEKSSRVNEAIELLRKDQESNLDHVGVLYELGMLYVRTTGRDWPARKMLSLFVTRCKRMKEAELKSRRLDVLLPEAQAALAALDQKLGV